LGRCFSSLFHESRTVWALTPDSPQVRVEHRGVSASLEVLFADSPPSNRRQSGDRSLPSPVLFSLGVFLVCELRTVHQQVPDSPPLHLGFVQNYCLSFSFRVVERRIVRLLSRTVQQSSCEQSTISAQIVCNCAECAIFSRSSVCLVPLVLG
jgi:hypothetical protein